MYEGRVPESAASMLNPNPVDGENLGGSILVNGDAVVRRRFNIPILFLVGERPAGAEDGAVVVSILDTGLIIFRGDVTGVGLDGGEGASKKFCGLI